MTESSVEVWPYWRDRYGAVEALKTFFPETLKADPLLSAALVQIEGAKLLIDKIMESK